MAMASPDELKKTQHSNEDSDNEAARSGSVVNGKSMARDIWEFKHRAMGLTLLALSWYNCDAGLELFAGRYGQDQDSSGAFWGVTGGLAGLLLILYALQIVRR
jgi:hypothetical protein